MTSGFLLVANFERCRATLGGLMGKALTLELFPADTSSLGAASPLAMVAFVLGLKKSSFHPAVVKKMLSLGLHAQFYCP